MVAFKKYNSFLFITVIFILCNYLKNLNIAFEAHYKDIASIYQCKRSCTSNPHIYNFWSACPLVLLDAFRYSMSIGVISWLQASENHSCLNARRI